jgi:hypothetical protein
MSDYWDNLSAITLTDQSTKQGKHHMTNNNVSNQNKAA